MEFCQDSKFIFFGTPHIGAVVLEKLIEADMKPTLVVTMPDKPANRGQRLTPSPVKVAAESHGIVVIEPKDFSSVPAEITAVQADLFIVAAYGKMLPKRILDIPPKGVLNMHPSLLPKYRGASPIQTTILNGDSKTGVTIILLDEEMDHGPVVAKKEYKDDISKITTPELKNELGVLAGELLVKTIPQWMKEKIISKPQDHAKATFTEIIKKEDGHIDWSKDAQYIERQVRAYAEWPGAYTFVEDTEGNSLRLKIIKASAENTAQGKPGIVLPHQDGLAVQTGSSLLIVHEIQMEGRNIMGALDFARGYPWIIGKILK